VDETLLVLSFLRSRLRVVAWIQRCNVGVKGAEHPVLSAVGEALFCYGRGREWFCREDEGIYGDVRVVGRGPYDYITTESGITAFIDDGDHSRARPEYGKYSPITRFPYRLCTARRVPEGSQSFEMAT
jgi:hypothetical protein